MKSKQIGKNREAGNDFMKMLDESLSVQENSVPGSAHAARVTSVKNPDFVFVDTGKIRGIIPRAELLDDKGSLTVNAGEKIHVFFLQMSGGENIFTTLPAGRNKDRVLESAMENQIPLAGKVSRPVKGGYEIQIGEARAFCPASQMPQNFDAENRSAKIPFLVIEKTDKNTVVSHRKFSDIRKEELRQNHQESLQEGDIVTGKVIKITNFGAFIDIGGLEGLIPIGECSFQRIKHPSEVLTRDQEVRVKVQQLNWKENRLTFSLKALQENPWQGSLPFGEGEILEGTVDSIKNFGIFVNLPGSFTGLIPAAESGVPKGKALDKDFQKGETLRVFVQRIDREREKISLSLTRVRDADTRKDYESYMANQDEGSKEGISSFGKQLLESLNSNQK